MKTFTTILSAAALASLALASPMVGPPICSPRTEKVGDGSPQQKYQYVQVSDNLQCGGDSGDSCSVAHAESKTVGWSATGGFSQWISGGFSVSESYTTGNSYSCSGITNQVVCVFDKIAYTAYTVETYGFGADCQQHGNPGVMTSPNSNNAGGEYICKSGSDCHEKDYSYWEDGAQGGPPS